ncbi:hypothetical protein CEXT_380411 [Caerostris extrusa]|uniref:Uncharacterized protein n=1 Tax=Caerostris extrusa TaxID=172846 RepID=A0AAV4QMF1_CAEEX|nr:hypothetical protein CEXT_380411 [Caerostris extrusa]
MDELAQRNRCKVFLHLPSCLSETPLLLSRAFLDLVTSFSRVAGSHHQRRETNGRTLMADPNSQTCCITLPSRLAYSHFSKDNGSACQFFTHHIVLDERQTGRLLLPGTSPDERSKDVEAA